jgi:2-polyprenyl-3-methyl-5-hydroxy-6-metoxy-1,4-benzoquinol methylase
MTVKTEVLSREHWDEQYRSRQVPWETGRPSAELQRVVAEDAIAPCRALEIGCGTGINAVWLARRGFPVTGIDLSPQAVRRAQRRAAEALVAAEFVVGDFLRAGLLSGPYDFFLDCGCYHAVRLADGPGYLRELWRLTRPGARGLVLMGNAAEREDRDGPPVLTEGEVRGEWGALFAIVRLHPFRFDARRPDDKRYLGWSCLVRRPG